MGVKFSIQYDSSELRDVEANKRRIQAEEKLKEDELRVAEARAKLEETRQRKQKRADEREMRKYVFFGVGGASIASMALGMKSRQQYLALEEYLIANDSARKLRLAEAVGYTSIDYLQYDILQGLKPQRFRNRAGALFCLSAGLFIITVRKVAVPRMDMYSSK